MHQSGSGRTFWEKRAGGLGRERELDLSYFPRHRPLSPDRARLIFAWLVFFFATSLLSENLAQASSRKRDEDQSLVCYASLRSTLRPMGNPSMLLVHVLCLLVTWQILDQLPGCFLGKALAFLIRGTAFQ